MRLLCAAFVAAVACNKSPFGLESRPANATCRAPPRPGSVASVGLQDAFAGLRFNQPLLVLQAPGDARFFVAEKGGTIQAVSGAVRSAFLDIRARVNATQSESGLLGVAFHPRWGQNRQAFVSYTAYSSASPANLRSTVSRFTSSDGGATLDAASEQVLLTVEQPYTNHNGGNIVFGPDGLLYFGLGDGGSGGDPQGNGQNLNVLLGKLLRIDVDSGSPYGIPPSNPFAAGGGRGEIYAYGLRNPWRFSFDRGTGALWLADVGQNAWEEVDVIQSGGNYGWNRKEGTHCYAVSPCAGNYIDPVVEYSHAEGISVTGGYVYRGSALPQLTGQYVYGDYGSGRIWAVPAGGPYAPAQIAQGANISSFGEGADGELYVADLGSGQISKLVASGGPGGGPAGLLSQTGCVDPGDATRPASGLVPYDVILPLWSDGADKERWVALPDGAQMHVGADGDFDLPVGSVVVKTFRLAGVRVETRLFVRHSDGGWAGYSYEWNPAQTDAALLPDGKTTASWIFPSRAQCLECHTAAAGFTLGLESAQLARTFHYPSGDADQLLTFAHIGLLDARPGTDRLSALDSGATAEQRSRSYLHANCSQCHRPGGTAQPDFRLSAPTSGFCDVPPQAGDLGIAGARLLAPGDPARSLILARMLTTGAGRMPPLATRVVDRAGSAVIEEWIRGLAGCP